MNNNRNISRHSGMSLIELMVAIVIGGILLAGLASVFFNSSRAQRELEKTGALIENGRYALSLLYEDLRHAGFYGHYFSIAAAPPALPDPCTTNTANLTAAMGQPIQGYLEPDAATFSGTNCNSLLNTNLSPGSDVLVIRRADTGTVSTMTTGNVYIQANSLDMNMYIGANNTPPTCDSSVPGTCKFPSSTPLNITPADTRQYRVQAYFVDNSNPALPVLSRLELQNGSMQIVPLAEGIEIFKVEYGIDDFPTAINLITGNPGDGVPDRYETDLASIAEWGNVVSVRIHLLARSPRPTDDYTDTKQYQLAGASFGPFNDNFKRHVYNTEVRPVNMAGRREIP